MNPKSNKVVMIAAIAAIITIVACGGGGGDIDSAQQQSGHQLDYPPAYVVPWGVSAYKAVPPANLPQTLAAPAVQDLLNGANVLPDGALQYQVTPPVGADHVYFDIIYSAVADSRWGISIDKNVSDVHDVFILLPNNVVQGTYSVAFEYTANGQLSKSTVVHFTISRTPAGTYVLAQSPMYFQGQFTSITPNYGPPTHAAQMTLTQNGSTLTAVVNGTVMTGTIYTGGWFSVANPSSGDAVAGQLQANGSVYGSAWHVDGGGFTSIYRVVMQPVANAPAPVQEQEPNDTQFAATPMGSAWSGTGTLSSSNDTDFFTKQLVAGTYKLTFDQGGGNVSNLTMLFDNGQQFVTTNTPAIGLTFTLKGTANAFIQLSADATHQGSYQFTLERTGKR